MIDLPASIRPLKEALEGPEKRLIIEAFEALGWSRKKVCRALDINRTTLWKKMKKYKIPTRSGPEPASRP